MWVDGKLKGSKMKNKLKRSIRRYKTYLHAKKQLQIRLGSHTINNNYDKHYQLGRYKKQNALDCGQPKCSCGNPRNHKWDSKKNTLTPQELRHLDIFDSQDY